MESRIGSQEVEETCISRQPRKSQLFMHAEQRCSEKVVPWSLSAVAPPTCDPIGTYKISWSRASLFPAATAKRLLVKLVSSHRLIRFSRAVSPKSLGPRCQHHSPNGVQFQVSPPKQPASPPTGKKPLGTRALSSRNILPSPDLGWSHHQSGWSRGCRVGHIELL